MEKGNRMFDRMFLAAWEQLSAREVSQICRAAGVEFDGAAFRLESLGRQLRVSLPDRSITPVLNPWHALTALHYLALSDGTPPAGKGISFAMHGSGLARGGGFDRDAEALIRDRLGTLSGQELRRRCRALGAEFLPGSADLCAKFSYLPKYPLYSNLWFADEEFPASGRLLLDASAEHHLTIEDAVTVGTLILDTLCAEA